MLQANDTIRRLEEKLSEMALAKEELEKGQVRKPLACMLLLKTHSYVTPFAVGVPGDGEAVGREQEHGGRGEGQARGGDQRQEGGGE